jgi:hypothetical protein
MHLKIPLLSRDLKLSNPQPYVVELQLFTQHLEGLFQLLVPALTLTAVSLLERKSWLEFVKQLLNI